MVGFFGFGQSNQSVKKVKGQVRYQLTPDGRDRAEDMEGHGNEVVILSIMHEARHPLAVKEIASKSHLDFETTIKTIHDLEGDKAIQKVRGS